jgi:hypothetical protein
MKSRTLLLMALLLAAAGASAQQYKWVDRNGRVQYGDTPPPGANATALRGPSARPSARPAAEAPAETAPDAAAKKGPPTMADRDAEFRKRREQAEKEREKQAKSSQQEQEKRENCENARAAARTLEGGRVSRTNAQGERYFMDEAEIQREMERARRAIKEACS